MEKIYKTKAEIKIIAEQQANTTAESNRKFEFLIEQLADTKAEIKIMAEQQADILDTIGRNFVTTENNFAIIGSRFGIQFNLIKQLSDKIDDAFKLNHNIDAAKASFLKETTSMDLCSTSTLHSGAYNNKIFTVGVKHANCTPSYAQSSVNVCSRIDAVIFGGCPTTPKAIDITHSVELRTGDKASTFGLVYDFGETKGFYWTGILSGRIGTSDNPKAHKDSYLFQAHNFLGMSGGPSLNGCDYTGMVNANYDLGQFNNAVVIPASLIKECIDEHLNKLKNISDCPKTTVHRAPRSSYECL